MAAESRSHVTARAIRRDRGDARRGRRAAGRRQGPGRRPGRGRRCHGGHGARRGCRQLGDGARRRHHPRHSRRRRRRSRFGRAGEALSERPAPRRGVRVRGRAGAPAPSSLRWQSPEGNRMPPAARSKTRAQKAWMPPGTNGGSACATRRRRITRPLEGTGRPPRPSTGRDSQPPIIRRCATGPSKTRAASSRTGAVRWPARPRSAAATSAARSAAGRTPRAEQPRNSRSAPGAESPRELAGSGPATHTGCYEDFRAAFFSWASTTAMAARLTMSPASTPRCRTWTDIFMPRRMGPMASAPERRQTSL
jgi:hypothetical protein